MHGGPSLGSRLVAVLVVFGRVEDGDAEETGLVDVRVEWNWRLEGEGWWHVRVIWREGEVAAEIASWKIDIESVSLDVTSRDLVASGEEIRG